MKALGNSLLVASILLIFGAGAYQLWTGTGFFGQHWGLLGVLAFWALPPLWIGAPFLMWAMEGVFPAGYFIAWALGWPGAGLLFVIGQALSSSEPEATTVSP